MMTVLYKTVFATIALLACGCRGNAGKDVLSTDSGSSDEDVEADGFPRACPDIYDRNTIVTFEVEIDDNDWTAMQRDCRNEVQSYRPIIFRYNGVSLDAMMRLKGNWSWNCDKMQFVISFNEISSGGRFLGLRKIVLDAPWYDPTFLHERLAFYFLERHGVPYSCANSARLNINGQYYGLYTNIERLDREYLERNFDLPNGNLYAEGSDLVTNENTADTSRNDAYWAANDLDALENLVDLDHAVSVWAGLAMAPDPDSYWAGVEINFYLYDHPTRGFLYLPYDMDIAFSENLWPQLVNADPIIYEHEDWLKETQYQAVLSDTYWCERFVEELKNARAAYDVTLLESKVDEWSSQIAEAAEEDPNKTFSLQEHEEALTALKSFFSRRAAFVDQWLADGGHCPAIWGLSPK